MFNNPSKRSLNIDRRPTETHADSDVKFQALTKQLSQLDATSSKIGETLKFISEFNKDNGGTVLGSHAPQHLQQLQQLRQKLKDVVVEIEELQGSEAASDSTTSSPTKEGAARTRALSCVEYVENGPRPSADTSAPANDGGTVTATVSRLTREAAEESAIALTRVKEEQRRLQALKKEVADLQRVNEMTSREVSNRDVRVLREQVSIRHSQLREAQTAEDELKRLNALAARLPQMKAEAEVLKPVVDTVAALEVELQVLRDVDDKRVQLSRTIASLQPKVLLVDKMKSKVEQLESELQRSEGLQIRVTVLQAEAEKLPALRTRMYSLQAGAAEARQLEKLMQDYGRQEELLVRLQHQEQEMQARVAGIEDLKQKVEMLRQTASEADQLEVRFASLATTASRLPVLRAQVHSLQERCNEVAELEAEEQRLLQVDEECKVLRRRVETLRPQADALYTLQNEVTAMHRAVAEAEALRALPLHNPNVASARAAALPGSVQAAVRSISDARGSVRMSSDDLSLISALQAEDLAGIPRKGAIRLTLNVVAPDMPLLPAGVTADLARKRAEVAAMAAAEAELLGLASHQERLRRQIDVLRASPAAAEVVRLQAQLVEMQGRQMQQLTAEVAGLAGAGEKLAALRLQYDALEKEADEAFVLQAQLPELEAAAAQAGMLRRRRDAFQAECEQVRELEAAISEAEAVLSQRPALESKLMELTSHREQIEAMQAQLAEGPAVKARLSRLQTQLQEIESQALLADQMKENLTSLRRQMVQAAGTAPNHTPSTEASASRELIAAVAADLPADLAETVATELAADNFPADSGLIVDGAQDPTHEPGAVLTVDGGWQIITAKDHVRTEEEEETAVMAAHLESVRAKHAVLVAQRMELLRLSAESQLLLKDNEVLQMQVNVAVSMYSASASVDCHPPVASIPEGEEGQEDNLSEEGSQPVTATVVAMVAGGTAEGGGRRARSVSTPLVDQKASTLDAVFQRMRVLESQNMGLYARNEELEVETDSLRAALDASLSRLDAFKGLAATVGMIRGKRQQSILSEHQ